MDEETSAIFFFRLGDGSLLAVRGGEQLLKNDLPRPQNIPQFQLSLIHTPGFVGPIVADHRTNGGQAANVRVPSLVNRFKRAIGIDASFAAVNLFLIHARSFDRHFRLCLFSIVPSIQRRIIRNLTIEWQSFLSSSFYLHTFKKLGRSSLFEVMKRNYISQSKVQTLFLHDFSPSSIIIKKT